MTLADRLSAAVATAICCHLLTNQKLLVHVITNRKGHGPRTVAILVASALALAAAMAFALPLEALATAEAMA